MPGPKSPRPIETDRKLARSVFRWGIGASVAILVLLSLTAVATPGWVPPWIHGILASIAGVLVLLQVCRGFSLSRRARLHREELYDAMLEERERQLNSLSADSRRAKERTP